MALGEEIEKKPPQTQIGQPAHQHPLTLSLPSLSPHARPPSYGAPPPPPPRSLRPEPTPPRPAPAAARSAWARPSHALPGAAPPHSGRPSATGSGGRMRRIHGGLKDRKRRPEGGVNGSLKFLSKCLATVPKSPPSANTIQN